MGPRRPAVRTCPPPGALTTDLPAPPSRSWPPKTASSPEPTVGPRARSPAEPDKQYMSRLQRPAPQCLARPPRELPPARSRAEQAKLTGPQPSPPSPGQAPARDHRPASSSRGRGAAAPARPAAARRTRGHASTTTWPTPRPGPDLETPEDLEAPRPRGCRHATAGAPRARRASARSRRPQHPGRRAHRRPPPPAREDRGAAAMAPGRPGLLRLPF